MPDFVLCSDCFQDQGLRLDAEQFGTEDDSKCSNCGSTAGRKLTVEAVARLAHRFFVWGTLVRCEYGAAPRVAFNKMQTSSIDTSPWFEPDLRLIEKVLEAGFFYYGPRTWMVGEVVPLKALQDPATRGKIIDRIISQYPSKSLEVGEIFYRIRKAPAKPSAFAEYDSPPVGVCGAGRFDAVDSPVMYGSQDLPVCVHECRVTAEDEIFVATLTPTKTLKLLDLSEVLDEGDRVTEFDSLDMAVHMLFLAGKHSYEISRAIAVAARSAGFAGIIYPSYFSLLRTGAMPFETSYGISPRRVRRLHDYENSKMIANLALFGRPIEDGNVSVRCIDRVMLSRVEYGIHFGPVFERR